MRLISITSLLLAGCALMIGSLPVRAQKTASPLPVEALAKANYLGAIVDVSPDGELVAYTIQDRTKREIPADEIYETFSRTGVPLVGRGVNVWVVNKDGKGARNLTEGQGHNWGPCCPHAAGLRRRTILFTFLRPGTSASGCFHGWPLGPEHTECTFVRPGIRRCAWRARRHSCRRGRLPGKFLPEPALDDRRGCTFNYWR